MLLLLWRKNMVLPLALLLLTRRSWFVCDPGPCWPLLAAEGLEGR